MCIRLTHIVYTGKRKLQKCIKKIRRSASDPAFFWIFRRQFSFYAKKAKELIKLSVYYVDMCRPDVLYESDELLKIIYPAITLKIDDFLQKFDTQKGHFKF